MAGDLFTLERVRPQYAERTDKFARFLHVADPLADELVVSFSERPSGRGRKMLDGALDRGLKAAPQAPAAMRAASLSSWTMCRYV